MDPGQSKGSVLIVDDSPMVVNLLNDILEPHGYQCGKAFNSAEAQERLAERPYDLLLADVNMPGDGRKFDVLRTLIGMSVT